MIEETTAGESYRRNFWLIETRLAAGIEIFSSVHIYVIMIMYSDLYMFATQ